MAPVEICVIILCALLSTWMKYVDGFQPSSRKFHTRPTISLNSASERKNLFFKIVEAGINDRFDQKDTQRIMKFCQYTKKELSLPPITEYMHEPCEEYIEGLTAKPWWNRNEFEWTADLEALTGIITNELLSMESKEIFKSDSRYAQTMGEGWTAFRLQRFGEWIEDSCQYFPQTTQILKSLPIPLAMRGVMFAKQLPYTGVKSHSDGRNFILTAHLGLQVPKNGPCWMKVGGIEKSWKEKEIIILDTSFIHETMNNSNENRYVLILDFWHPELTPIERECLAYIYDARNKYDNNKMNEIDSSYIKEMNTPSLFGGFKNWFK